MADAPQEWMTVFDRDRGAARCRVEDEPVVDAAVSDYLDSGGTRDRLLALTTTGGCPYKILASHITSWALCTLDAVELEASLDAAIKHHEKPWATD